MSTWLDNVVERACRSGTRYVPGEVQLNQLQPALIQDGRLEHRLEPHVLIIESARVAGVADERVCFVLHDLARGRRVAAALVPEKVHAYVTSRARVHAMLSGGDLNALITFRGKDIVHNIDDCMCLFARLEPELFSDHGFEQARVGANPSARIWELRPKGTNYVRVPWVDDNGEERSRSIEVIRRVRRYPRRAA